jgi:hypothetical protein
MADTGGRRQVRTQTEYPSTYPIGTYRFVVLCTKYGYVPAACVVVTESENVPLARP